MASDLCNCEGGSKCARDLCPRCCYCGRSLRPTEEEAPEMPPQLLHELTKRWDVPMPFADARAALKEAYARGFEAGRSSPNKSDERGKS